MRAATVGGAGRQAFWRAFGIALIGLLALLHVPFPFDHDQGLFMAAARSMVDGARLYADFWDMKQPGIYWYYFAAGRAFGFDEVGLHLLDLLWMVSLAGLLIAISARTLKSELLIVLTPLLCLGPFYAAASPFHLSQVEILVALPLAGTMLLMLGADFSERSLVWRCAGAGALGAVVILFKAILGVVPAAMILAALWHAARREKTRPGEVFRRGLVPALAGAFAVLAPAMAYLAYTGTLGDALWTLFTYPRIAIGEYPSAPPWRLRVGIEWFTHATWTLFPFVLVGAWYSLRRRSAFALLVGVWLVGCGLETLAQRLSWWEYHFDLFFVPVGLFAADGLDVLLQGDVAERSRYRIGAAALGLAAFFAVTAVPIARKASLVLANPSPFVDRIAVMLRIDHSFEAVMQAERLLADPAALRGDIAVLGGDGRIILYAHRPILWSVNGAAHFLAAQVIEEAHAIERDRPAYIYLAPGSRYLYTHGTDEIERYVASHYVEKLHDVRDGIWYERNDAADAQTPGTVPPERQTH